MMGMLFHENVLKLNQQPLRSRTEVFCVYEMLPLMLMRLLNAKNLWAGTYIKRKAQKSVALSQWQTDW